MYRLTVTSVCGDCRSQKVHNYIIVHKTGGGGEGGLMGLLRQEAHRMIDCCICRGGGGYMGGGGPVSDLESEMEARHPCDKAKVSR